MLKKQSEEEREQIRKREEEEREQRRRAEEEESERRRREAEQKMQELAQREQQVKHLEMQQQVLLEEVCLCSCLVKLCVNWCHVICDVFYMQERKRREAEEVQRQQERQRQVGGTDPSYLSLPSAPLRSPSYFVFPSAGRRAANKASGRNETT